MRQLADHFIVSALLDDQLRLFLVPAPMEGVEVTPYKMYDGSRAGDLALSGVALDRDSLLPGDAAPVIRTVADNESALMCAEATRHHVVGTGADPGVFEDARAVWAEVGIEFQALQHSTTSICTCNVSWLNPSAW